MLGQFALDINDVKDSLKEANYRMPRVEVRADESLERALKRFKRKLEREGILKDLKAKKHYEKPSERRRRRLRTRRPF